MNVSIMSVVNAWKKEEGLHICYIYYTKEYIETTISFVISGIRNGEIVLLVENERNMLQIMKELDKKLSKKQLDNIHFINNFDFYWSNGDLHPQTISFYFSKLIDPLLKTGTFVRTWANIEWGNENEVSCKIEEFEKTADSLVKRNKILSVCAYDRSKVLYKWETTLTNCHNITIT